VSYEEIKFLDGSFRREWRAEDGKLHREYGPAYIYYYTNGSTKHEFFCLNGALHRELGPAEIRYDPDGSINMELFYLNGKFLGENREGFWKLWDNLTEEQRNNQELLKYLTRFS
jgi:antitoxin component YwqK of YwqJK toxin-antitoxin module